MYERNAVSLWAMLLQDLALFAAGGAAYGLLELIWRGRTHWTMLLAGGAGLLVLRAVSRSRLPFWGQCLAGCGAITALELVIGLLCNRLLCWNVWDYSDRWGNLLGQICPAYSLLWLGLSVCILQVLHWCER